jgi:UDP-N-acetylglucosamine 2-epimerase (non-hydrolysing)
VRIVHVVGARPNFIKISPLINAFTVLAPHAEQLLVHTGQHYDSSMSDTFFEELRIPEPDFNLGVGSGSSIRQIANIMLAFEPILREKKPDWVVLVGDVNSTIACALVSAKLGIPIAHVEAGLRSYDSTMPEEVNRVVTDHLSTLLFTPSEDATANLLREGINARGIEMVGNVMIDAVKQVLPKAKIKSITLREELGFEKYILATLHRPSNVDDSNRLNDLLVDLGKVSKIFPVVMPIHPRTKERLTSVNMRNLECIRMIPPCGYVDFIALQYGAELVLTDSGGVQEETTFLGVPCLTLRANTERPVTITHGTNKLVRPGEDLVSSVLNALKRGTSRAHSCPPFWDGCTAPRIVGILLEKSSSV